MKNYILTMDIGGTTFTSALFDSDFNQVGNSMESYVKEYGSKLDLISGFTSQLKKLYSEHNISMDEVIGLGISVPGPLDSQKGLILDTPNLTMLKNTNLAGLMEAELSIPVQIENDANLFVWGEWYRHYRKESVIIGLTLGSGLGVGVVIEGRVFTGAHGMGAEYGISPVKGGVWEDDISIEGIEKLSIKELSELKSPKELFQMAKAGDEKAQKIWQKFGYKLGLVSSHLVNLMDPAVIILGGGISRAFPYFIESMEAVLSEYSPSFLYHSIKIKKSEDQLYSTHLGAALFIKQKN
jgi:glucokinase